MLFQNILVPVDMSKQSTRAFKIALDISKKYNSKLTIITCVEIYPSFHLFYQQRPIPKLLLGSVANGVSQKAHCPIMIIK